MITVREIRLGDLVLYDNEKWLVRGIEEDELRLERNQNEIKVSPDEVGPIQLTEQLLLDLGFEVSDEEEGNATPLREYNFKGIVISLFKINEPIFLYCADDTFKGNTVTYSRPPLRYLHQLQNLFFVLTGKEMDLGNIK